MGGALSRLGALVKPDRRRCLLAAAPLSVPPLAPAQPSFDAGHAAWTALLRKHVVLLRGGQATVSLDDIEHGILRARGAYDDPRVHFAVNCASVGCPMLREEAFVAERIDAQLDEQALRFISDRTRNRWNAPRGRLELSKIFDWYGEDFGLGHRGIGSVPAFATRHAEALADAPADRERIRGGRVDIAFLDYDWALNAAR
jgi:hypothetical protein